MLFLPMSNNLSNPILSNISPNVFLSLHKLENISLSELNNFSTSLFDAINSGLSYNLVTSSIVESNTGLSEIIGIAFSLLEQFCKIDLPFTSKPKFLLLVSGSPSSLNNL